MATEDCSLVTPDPCPGLFCGRQFTNSSADHCYSECGACWRGYRTDNGSSECVQCSDEAELRDYMFLGFFCLTCIVSRMIVVGVVNIKRPSSVSKLGVALLAVVENILAMLLTLIVLEPRGLPYINSCPVNSITDFYPIFFNPTRDYVHQIQCTYEVVYPLYTMVFVFFGFSFLVHLLSLAIEVPLLVKSQRSLHYYTELCWLIVFPAIVLSYAVLAGVFYYIFDYLAVIVPLGAFLCVSTTSLIKLKAPLKLYRSPDYWAFSVVCVLCLIFGIVALTDSSEVEFRLKLLPLALAPPILHPILSYFASPTPYFEAWGVET